MNENPRLFTLPSFQQDGFFPFRSWLPGGPGPPSPAKSPSGKGLDTITVTGNVLRDSVI